MLTNGRNGVRWNDGITCLLSGYFIGFLSSELSWNVFFDTITKLAATFPDVLAITAITSELVYNFTFVDLLESVFLGIWHHTLRCQNDTGFHGIVG